MRYALLLLAFTVICAGQPNAEEVIRRSIVVNDADFQAFPHYSRLETSGSKSIKTVEVRLLDGSPYEKLILRDGRPLSTPEEQQEQAKFNREAERRKAESQAARVARIAKFNKSLDSETRMMHQIADAFLFKIAGEEIVNGRPTG